MINTALLLRNPIDYILRNTTNTEFLRIGLTSPDWEALTHLKSIFELFKKPLIKLQGQVYTTISIGLLYIFQLLKNLQNLQQSFELRSITSDNVFFSIYSKAIQEGLLKLGKYFPTELTYLNLKDYKVFLFSIILDPQFKTIHFRPQGLLYHYPTIEEDVKNLFIQEYNNIKFLRENTYLPPEGSTDELYNPDFTSVNRVSESESNSDEELYPNYTSRVEEYDLYLYEDNCSPKVKKTLRLVEG
ncbi:hypothetical protein KAF25_002876 [Fusarium avenaceum]|uniref:Uncharacterized protein n=1 Tax=Fusarium avenaceum TaxID=40199 RepID=A0A9P7GQ83_9HYPO|nr:hypothetical protein KAF25_002876 [Fusarium avenaceum]